MEFNNIDELKNHGFVGFKSIGELFTDQKMISKERGVYLVLYCSKEKPQFLQKGVGGFFKGKNPNVSINELEKNWVEDTLVVYIGQAGGSKGDKSSEATLSSRLKTYLSFGMGKNVGHYGGRYIWQIKDYRKLLICWKSLPDKSIDPKEYEDELINDFKIIYNRRPFANLLG